MDDSGPNLLVRVVEVLLVLAGVLLIRAGYRMRTGAVQLPFSPSMNGYWSGVFIIVGGAVILLATILLAVGLIGTPG